MGSYSCCTSVSSREYKDVSSLSSLLKLIGEESRLKLLCMLRQGEHCVCELMEHTKLSQSLISHHLKDLKDADLISDTKKEQWVYYSLTKKGQKISDSIFNLKK